MTKKIIFFSIISLLLFFALSGFALAAKIPCNPTPTNPEGCPKGQLCMQREKEGGGVESVCERSLEIAYPGIPGGGVVPKTTGEGLPEYVKYIFQLSVIIIGFVIFGALMYNGVQYLASAGNPAKMSDSREGIFSAFLGAIILLSAYILFNTINPQLTILTLPEVSPVPGVVPSGVYLCGANIDDKITTDSSPFFQETRNALWTSFGMILDAYIDKDWDKPNRTAEEKRTEAERQIWAAQWLKALGCVRVTTNNLGGWTVKQDTTVYIVPDLSYVDEGGKTVKKVKYEYGIVFFEEDNWKGQCDYFPKEDANRFIYTYAPLTPGGAGVEGQQIAEYRPKDLNFNTDPDKNEARSMVVFQRPGTEPPSTARGIILYPCLDYSSTPSMCPTEVNPTTGLDQPIDSTGLDQTTFGADILKVPRVAPAGETSLGKWAENIRSIFIEPEGSYFALVFDGTQDFKGKCYGIYSSMRDIRRLPIENKDTCTMGTVFWDIFRFNNKYDCVPMIRSMIVIKGMPI